MSTAEFDEDADDDAGPDEDLDEVSLDDLSSLDPDADDEDEDAVVAVDAVDDDLDEDLDEDLDDDDGGDVVDDDEEDDEEEDDEEEESLDVLLAREKVLDEDDIGRSTDDARDGLSVRPALVGAGEFTCRSCFLVKRRAQLANEKRLLCFDCA